MTRGSVALLALAMAACGSRESSSVEPAPVDPDVVEPAPSEPAAVVAEPAGPLAIDARDQYAMMEEMRAAETVAVDAQAEAFDAVRTRWEGHRFRWEMMRVAGLCTRAESCLFAPFDHARFDHPGVGAFLPRVSFDAGEHSRLSELCAPHGTTCVVTFEATLEAFTFSIAEPTTLTMTDPHVVSVRAIRENEYFLSRPPPAVGGAGVPVLRRALGAPAAPTP